MLRPFQSETHAKRTYRELKLLMHLNHSDAQVRYNIKLNLLINSFDYIIGCTIIQCIYTRKNC